MDKHMDAHGFFVNESGILVNPMTIEVNETPFVQLDLFGNDINAENYALG
jgi:hypothetical protein